jgi:peptidoglycan/xylan/chitin deacetylase (PgdA/CDA1 family)
MSKSAALGAILRRLGICSLVLHARRRGWLRRDSLTILGYHRIATLPADGFTGEDDNISCSPADFEREIGLLRRYFTPIRFEDLLASRARSGGLPPNPLILTFDDGYRDNFDVAAPILSRHGITACFFLTTGFLSGEAVPWWDAVNLAVRLAPAGKVRLPNLDGLELELGSTAARARAGRVLRQRFRGLPARDYAGVLQELSGATGCDLGPAVFRPSFMNWDQARALRDQGHEIGAHTRTHPVLTRVGSEQDLDTEVAGSRADLERRLETRVLTLAYPVGGRSAVDQRVVDAARRAGFEFACTYQEGLNSLRRLDCLAMRRISVGAGASYAHFYVKMAFPWLFRRAAT